jgi:CheY-like chemotaxis protein
MDINMPGIDGIEASRSISRDHPGTVVFLLSTYRADDLPDGAASCGAAGYIHKEEFGSVVLRELWERHGAPPEQGGTSGGIAVGAGHDRHHARDRGARARR